MAAGKKVSTDTDGANTGSAENSTAEVPTHKPKKIRFVVVHGDKGGVGKSMTAMVLTDLLLTSDIPVAVIDADTRNPDVGRMFRESECPNIGINLRATDGWMDVIDFVHQNPDHTFILSMPAGISESMDQEFADFVRFLKGHGEKTGRGSELILWWVINLFPDSINLLQETIEHHGKDFHQVVVVRNNIFGQPSDFVFWNDTPLCREIEKKGGLTVDLPPLYLRIMRKLFDPKQIMPFSLACSPEMHDVIGFLPSEGFKLEAWFTQHVPAGLGAALQRLKVDNV